MAASTSTSFCTPTTPVLQRSVTLPMRLSEPTRSQRENISPSQDSQVETLYAHPSARVVKFSAGSRLNAKGFSGDDAATAEEEAGCLSWTSKLERTIAVGPLRVYRAPHSVAFLNCGHVVQAILPKSKCWCVEESTGKFVLQMRRPQYWRIEINDMDPNDLQQLQGLKDVFSEILLFEKTICPFQRSFTVDLPEAPAAPIKYKPWKPTSRPVEEQNRTSMLDMTKDNVVTTSQEITQDPESGDDYFTAASDDSGSIAGTSSNGDATEIPPDTTHQSLDSSANNEIGSRPGVLLANRSVTAPPQLTLMTSPASKASKAQSSTGDMSNESSTDVPSVSGSFHSVQSWHSPIVPSLPSPHSSESDSPVMFPYPHDTIRLPKRPHHVRDMSEATVTPGTPQPRTPGAWESSDPSFTKSISEENEGFSTPPPRTPTLIDDNEDHLDEEHFEIATPSAKQQLRHRPTTGSNSHRRALSPLPPAANIFSPKRRRPRHQQTTRHLPTAILQKTCEILLSPPSHLLHLMLDIAAKIAAGEWRGMVYGLGEGGEQVVGRWDYGDGDTIADLCNEDDYGLSLPRRELTRRRTDKSAGESWEID
ncbi:MAG: hypothetical protein M1818_003087 [Claussenomyces sp. TS43310]|nr:MAG: hypothetical protein M1818_003087 [Claussenomyces sp. TS43310]